MSPNRNIFDLLKHINLNVNSEVAVALTKNNTWEVFEVYNQAIKHNGVLSIKKLFDYNGSENIVLKNSQSKYIKRRNMTGVVFNTYIVVSCY